MQDDDKYNDMPLQSFQDDLNTDDNTPDPLMAELTDDPTEALDVPPERLAEELGKLHDDEDEADDDDIDIHDDEREYLEDLDDPAN